LQWTDSGDWETVTGASDIIWLGNSLVPPTGLPRLNGVILRIGVNIVAPFTMAADVINGSGQTTIQLSGYVPDLIQLLQIAMGFIPDIVLIPSNQTYDEMVQAVADNVYDIVVSDVTVTAKRREIADFSSSIFDNSLRIIIRNSASIKVDLLAYLGPFSTGLWLVILGILLYAAVVMCLLEGRENDALKDKSLLSSAAMSVWYSFGNIAGYGVDFNVQTAAGRLLTVGLYILSIILVASYTANLASNLTVSKTQNIISGLDDIKNGKIAFSRIGIVVGSAVEDYYLQEISGGIQNFYPLKSQSDIYTCLLNNTIDASMYDVGLLEYETNTEYCSLTLVGSDFDPSAYGIVFRKNWPYAQAFDVTILSLRESGTLDYLTTEWFAATTCAEITDTATSYNIRTLAGLFLTFAIISILSLLLFAWLKRLIIKDYLWKLVHRKGGLVKQNGVGKTLPTHFDYETSQTPQPDSVSSLVVHL